MQGEQIHIIETQILEARVERPQKFFRRFFWSDFGLDDDFVTRQSGQNVAELHLGTAVATGSFEMVDAQLERAMNRRFEIGLVLCGNLAGWNILPLELKAHASARKDGHA